MREEAHIGWAGGATGDRALGVGQALSHEDATAEGSQVGIVAWRHNRHRARAAAEEVAHAAPRNKTHQTLMSNGPRLLPQ